MADCQTRLDRYLVSRGFFATGAHAGDAVLRGAVELNGIGVLSRRQCRIPHCR
jgi:predicted rRNA methylase YqxC with S4 and FtsJ domains